MYFYALTAQFGQWLKMGGQGQRGRQWQVAAGLIYGQVKKSYRRRKLVRVSLVMRLGTGAALEDVLQVLGLSGRLNTAFIEPVNLSVRQGWLWHVARGPQRSSPHNCWLTWNGGELMIILYGLMPRYE